ncbi:MAG: protein kinase [Polyangiaceae bacterium]|nr:protein kinase [Polyangiaceae bacterium]
MSSCPSENTLAEFLDGRLTGTELIRFYEHASGCTACTATLAGLPHQVASLSQSGESATDAGVPPSSSPSQWQASLMQPAAVGRYRPLQVLGAGGMGVVYLARDTQLNRNVALKVTQHDVSLANVLRLLREAQVMARLSHRNVVAVYDVGLWQQHVFVAMEHLEGGTLARYLLECEHPWPEVLDKFLQAGRGLAAAHSAGIAHRDFKAENVLLTASGEARVADFGLARALAAEDGDHITRSEAVESRLDAPDVLRTPLTRVGTVMGTLAYMAPEQIRGEVTDHRADIWSYCAALYEALYCELPFPGRTPREVLKHVELGSIRRPPLRSDVPSWLRRILVAGLHPDPQARIPSMDALLHELERKHHRRPLRTRTKAALGVAGVAAAVLAPLVARHPPTRVSPEDALDADAEAAQSPAVPAPQRTPSAATAQPLTPASASTGPDPRQSERPPSRHSTAALDRTLASTTGRPATGSVPSNHRASLPSGPAAAASAPHTTTRDGGGTTPNLDAAPNPSTRVFPPAVQDTGPSSWPGHTHSEDAPIIRD